MEIRLCQEADIDCVGEFYDRVVLWLEAHINYPKWEYKVYPSKDFVIEKTKDKTLYVCFDKEQIVGAFVLNNDPQGDYQKGDWSIQLDDGEYLVIHSLAIAPEVQGQGFGKQVIDYCIYEAKRLGYPAIRLDVVPDNIPAKKLYEKNGFTYFGDYDLGRGIEEIPEFSLYELNI